jgi:GxxExxY protein
VHPKFERANILSKEAIGAAIEVHRTLGPGLLESVYEICLMRELELRSLHAEKQQQVRIEYKGIVFEESLRFDILIEGCLLIEVKAVQGILPIHKAQVISYLKLLDVPLGLLINFYEVRLVDGVTRLLIPGLNQ